jgi:PKD repeat protein
MVTDSLGCMASEDFDVTSNILEDATFGALSNICSGDTIPLLNANTTGAWSGTVVTDQGNGVGFAQGASGIYDITYTTSGACPDAHTESVEIYATPTAAFTNSGNITVDFVNTSTGGVTCMWDLGDGTTSTQCDPTHTYPSDGNYTVCLTTTSSDGCTDSICQTVSIQGVGVNENSATGFKMYPNPTEGLVTITTQANATVQLINIVGEVVWTSSVIKTADLDFSDLSKGSYFVKVNTNGKIETKKLIIQ